jgi:acyl dehydratase
VNATYSLNFTAPPSVMALYPRILSARKPAHVPDGQQVSRLEAHLAGIRIDAAHLARYREVCGIPAGSRLPIAYPHVLASPLHLALLSSDKFPVRLLGLVHVRNRIEQTRPLTTDEGGELATWIEGHRDLPRGQEFDLQTEWRAGSQVLWRETCTFLARRREGARADTGPAPPAAANPRVHQPVRTVSFRAPAGLGRRYGWISGDINPIHLADLTARAFGFRSAIAHGMWSLARCASELPVAQFDAAASLDVQFRQPVHLPAWVMLHSWASETLDGGTPGTAFELRDAQGERVHLSGRLQPEP